MQANSEIRKGKFSLVAKEGVSLRSIGKVTKICEAKNFDELRQEESPSRQIVVDSIMEVGEALRFKIAEDLADSIELVLGIDTTSDFYQREFVTIHFGGTHPE